MKTSSKTMRIPASLTSIVETLVSRRREAFRSSDAKALSAYSALEEKIRVLINQEPHLKTEQADKAA